MERRRPRAAPVTAGLLIVVLGAAALAGAAGPINTVLDTKQSDWTATSVTLTATQKVS